MKFRHLTKVIPKSPELIQNIRKIIKNLNLNFRIFANNPKTFENRDISLLRMKNLFSTVSNPKMQRIINISYILSKNACARCLHTSQQTDGNVVNC